MSTNNCHLLADYLESTYIPDWDYANFGTCGLGRCHKIFKEFTKIDNVVFFSGRDVMNDWSNEGISAFFGLTVDEYRRVFEGWRCSEDYGCNVRSVTKEQFIAKLREQND